MLIPMISSLSCGILTSKPRSCRYNVKRRLMNSIPYKNFSDMDNLTGLQATLEQVYSQMLPLCSNLIGTAQGIAGFAALWYIAARVWRSIAAAEPIDFYPLLRPFALGMAILLFPTVIAVINGVMSPTVSATGGMVQNSDIAIARLLKAKEAALKNTEAWQAYVGDNGNGDENRWYKYTHPGDTDGS